jgi:uncharacterized repeat protein (TIGR02543 family)
MKRISLVLATLFMALSVSMVLINCDTDGGTTTYTVTFDSNGGSTVAPIGGISSGATITLPTNPTKGTDTFVGWFNDNGTFLNEFTASTAVTGDITVYAKWTPIPVSPFEGSWKGWNGDGSSEKIWQFTGNNFVTIIGGINNAKGTFSYTETTITITATYAWNESAWEPWLHTFPPLLYTISGNNLTLEGDGNGLPFVKQ